MAELLLDVIDGTDDTDDSGSGMNWSARQIWLNHVQAVVKAGCDDLNAEVQEYAFWFSFRATAIRGFQKREDDQKRIPSPQYCHCQAVKPSELGWRKFC